jgi:enterochelin esterase family protein
MKTWICIALASGSTAFAALDSLPGAQTEAATPVRKPGEYKLGPDSLPQDGVPKGKLEGPCLFSSRIFTNTVRQYWIFVPAQYSPDKPPCLLVFQDGQRATRSNGSLRVPQVMENLINHEWGDGSHSDNHGGAILPEILRWLWKDYPK